MLSKYQLERLVKNKLYTYMNLEIVVKKKKNSYHKQPEKCPIIEAKRYLNIDI